MRQGVAPALRKRWCYDALASQRRIPGSICVYSGTGRGAARGRLPAATRGPWGDGILAVQADRRGPGSTAVVSARPRPGDRLHRHAVDRRRPNAAPRPRRVARLPRKQSHPRTAPERGAREYLHGGRWPRGSRRRGGRAEAHAAVGTRRRAGGGGLCPRHHVGAGRRHPVLGGGMRRRGGDSNPR